jgi:hypothetical protein
MSRSDIAATPPIVFRVEHIRLIAFGAGIVTRFESLSRGLIETMDSQLHRATRGEGTHPCLSFPVQVAEDNVDTGAIPQK